MDAEFSEAFQKLKAELESHPRLAGYYLIKLACLRDLRRSGTSQEQLLDTLFEWFDDQPWTPPDKRPKDQLWGDYRVSREVARQQVADALEGGPQIGHIHPTIPRQTSEAYFDRFDDIFARPKEYFIGMGLGNPDYVFLQGVAIVSEENAGLLWVVESD